MEIENLTWVTTDSSGKKKRVKLLDLEQAHLVKIKQHIAKSPKWKDPIKSKYVQECQKIIDYKDKKDEAFDKWFYNFIKPFEKNGLNQKTQFFHQYFVDRQKKNKINK